MLSEKDRQQRREEADAHSGLCSVHPTEFRTCVHHQRSLGSSPSGAYETAVAAQLDINTQTRRAAQLDINTQTRRWVGG